MRVFRMTYTDKSGAARQSKKWAIEVRDHQEHIRRVAGFTDKTQTQELGRKIEKLIAARANDEQPEPGLRGWFEAMPQRTRMKLVEWDLISAKNVAASKPLAEHLKDFRRSLEAKGNSPEHVDLVTTRAKKVVEGCGFRSWSDISASRVQSYLHDRRQLEKNFGAQTFNFYLQAIKQFCRWMVKDRRAIESPLAHLDGLNVKTDRRHDRRALAVDEMRRLLHAAENGSGRQGRTKEGKPTWYMTGPERAMLYRLAMETGLRSSELRSLGKSSFGLDADPPTVTVAAAYSKRRRNDTLPLRPETAEALRPFLASLTTEGKVFKMPNKGNVVKLLLLPDLEEARKRWLAEAEDARERSRREASDFLRYVDGAGRYADFHALRHSFITNLGRTGTHFKTAQDLARHSTPMLTARYTHGFKEDEVAAVNALPDLVSIQPQEARATGTDGRGGQENSALYSASEGADRLRKVQSGAVSSEPQRQASEDQRPRKTLARLGLTELLSGGGGIRTHERDEPSAGFQDRFLKPLGHPTESSAVA